MNSDCHDCGGECCKDILIPMDIIRAAYPGVDEAWLEARGEIVDGETWRIDKPCRYLTRSGRCSIYPNRPALCRAYEPGSEACKATRKGTK